MAVVARTWEAWNWVSGSQVTFAGGEAWDFCDDFRAEKFPQKTIMGFGYYRM